MAEVTDQMKDIGRQLLKEMDKTEHKPTAMLWSDALEGRQRLLIATLSARVDDQSGRDPIQQEITAMLEKIAPGQDVPFGLTAPANAYLRAIAGIFSTGPNDDMGAEMSNNFINGMNSGNIYLYRLNIQ